MALRSSDDVLDELLVLQSQGGSAEAFRQLVARWNRRFVGFASQLTGRADAALDVAQEAWLAVISRLGSLEDPARFKAWAYRILSFKAADWVRRETRERGLKLPETAAPAEEGIDEPLHAALRGLTGDQRALLHLFYVEDLKVPDVALVLGIPEGTVKSRLFHARELLKETLERSPV